MQQCIEQRLYEKRNGIKVLRTKDLEEWIENSEFRDCDIIKKYKGELFSMIEQVILSQVTLFVPWPRSSWSARISMLRNERHGLHMIDMLLR